MEDVQSNKKKMKELEDNLLYRLTSTKVMEALFLVLLARQYHQNMYSFNLIYTLQNKWDLFLFLFMWFIWEKSKGYSNLWIETEEDFDNFIT